MNELVLFVDDEPNILSALSRQFRDEAFTTVTASDGIAALGMLAAMPIAVMVSDNMMPGMSGIELLGQAKAASPDTVRILLTGHADLNAAIRAINSGEVYKFITKPWDPDGLRAIILDALEKHRMTASLRSADEAMLKSLAQTIELKDRYTRGHCDRVAEYADRIAQAYGLSVEMRMCIRYGSWLHDCGKIGIPEAILNQQGALTAEQREIVRNHCQWGADVARLAKLADGVVNVILHHHENYDGSGYPAGLSGEAIPLEARIVAVADTYDSVTTDRPYQKGMSREQGLAVLARLRGTRFDPAITDLFLGLQVR